MFDRNITSVIFFVCLIAFHLCLSFGHFGAIQLLILVLRQSKSIYVYFVVYYLMSPCVLIFTTACITLSCLALFYHCTPYSVNVSTVTENCLSA